MPNFGSERLKRGGGRYSGPNSYMSVRAVLFEHDGGTQVRCSATPAGRGTRLVYRHAYSQSLGFTSGGVQELRMRCMVVKDLV